MIANPSVTTQTQMGSYTGTGSAHTEATGFKVGFVIVIGVTAGRCYMACDTGNNATELTTAPAINPGSSYLKCHASDGFTVNGNCNNNTQTYYYFAAQAP